MISRNAAEERIAALFGVTARGRPDLAGFASAAGVSVATVRRWLRGEGSWERLGVLLSGHGEPVWDRSLLVLALGVRFGLGKDGHVRPTVLAAALNVSPRTVQRWFAGKKSLHIPAGRMDEVMALFQPPKKQLELERASRQYAVDSLAVVRVPAGRRKSMYTWRRDGWLESHFVSVVRVKGYPELVRPVVSIPTDKALARLHSAGLVEDTRLCENRFTALVIKYEMLKRMEPWRVRLAKSQLARGGTETWLARAPRPMLAELSVPELEG